MIKNIQHQIETKLKEKIELTKHLGYGAGFLIKTKIFRQKIPFIAGFVLNEACNLNCEHCSVNRKEHPEMGFDQVKLGLYTLYHKGIRLLAITGGEPYLWRDGEKTIEDVIAAARKIGFRVVSLYTNGTFPLNSSADTLFVSIDGLEDDTKKLRGDIYHTVLNNIRSSNHPNIIINHTINKQNYKNLKRFCDTLIKEPNIKGFFFYFHTPYNGLDQLYLPLEEKRPVIKEILRLKKKYPIFNSVPALKSVYNDTWKRPTDVCLVYANNRLFKCCRAIGNKEACDNCGYMGYPEIIALLKGYPGAIRDSLNYLPVI